MTEKSKSSDIESRFSYKCSKRWEDLTKTSNEGVKHCSQCDESVYLAKNEGDINNHAEHGRCVAVRWDDNEKESKREGEPESTQQRADELEVDTLDMVGYLRPISQTDNSTHVDYLDLPPMLGRVVSKEPEKEEELQKTSWLQKLLGIFRLG